MNSKHLLDKSPICFALVENSREIVYANPALCGFLGYSAAELKSKKFMEVTHPDDIESDVCQFQRLLAGEISEYRMQKRYLHQSGRVLWGDLFVSLIPDELRSGQFTILASVVDINELKMKELRLDEERSNFKAMFQNNPQAMGIYAIDDFSILEMNQAASILYGYSREELLRMKVPDLTPPEHVKIFQEFVSKNESTLGGSQLWVMITKTGERRIIESASHPIEYEGRAARHVMLIDVTEKEKATRALKENEAFISRAEEIAGMGSWEWDIENNVTKWSDNTYRIFGVDPQTTKPTFEIFLSIVHPDDRHLIDALYNRLIEEKEKLKFEHRIVLPGNEILWLENIVEPVFEGNQLVCLKGVNVDITERKEAELKLQEKDSFIREAEVIAGMGSWEWDFVNQCGRWSDNLYRLLHYEKGSVAPVFANFIQKVHPDDRDAMEVRYAHLLQTKEKIAFELRFLFDGKVQRWYQNYIEPETDANGSLVKLKGVSIDITRQKKVELTLLENRRFNRLAQRIANMGSWEFDIEQKTTRWSTNFFRMLQCTKGEVDPSFDLFKSKVYPLDQTILDQAIETMFSAPQLLEFELRLHIGSDHVWVKNTVEPVFDNDRLVKLRGICIDITQRKIQELAILKNRDSIHQAQVIAKMGSWEFDPISNILTWSQNLYKLLKVDPNQTDLSFEFVKSLVHPDDRHLFGENRVSLKDSQSQLVLEFRMLLPDEQVIWVQEHVHLVFKDGKLVLLRGVIIDITERKEREIELLQLSKAVEQSPVSIVITNREGNLEYVNPKFTEVSGYSKQEAIGNNPRVLKSELMNEEVYTDLWQTIISGKTWEGELINKNKEGGFYWENALISPITDGQGCITNFVGIKEDITARKRTEKIRETLVDISNAVLQTDDLETFFNMVFSSLGQLTTTPNFFVALYDESTQRATVPFITDTREKELIEFSIDKTLTGLVVRNKKPLFLDVDSFNDLVKSGEVELFGPPSLAWIGVPLFGDEKVIGVMVLQSYEGEPMLNNDDLKLMEYVAPQISLAFERKKHVEELKKALEKAKESDRLKSSFLATMSHELRTPLNPIIGFSSLILDESDDPMVQEFSQLINNSGKEMLRLIEDLFDLSFHKGQNIKNNPQPVLLVDLYSLARAYLEEALENVGKTDRIEIVFDDLALNLCYELRLDQGKVLQILAILFNNAVKYTEQGRIEFKIDILQNPQGVRFAVTDTGIGMKEEKIAIIFDEFRQLDDSHTREYGGLGIGLAIAKTLSEIMDGDISVESQEGVGTTICLEIPTAINIREDVGYGSCLCGDEEFSIINGKSILVVDDNHFIYELIKKMLSKFDVDLIYVRNGKEAVELVKERVPDFILMDLVMPVMNGIDATLHIRSVCPRVPIAVLTAHSMAKDRQRAFEAGCDTVITKPVHRDILVKILKNHLEKAEVLVAKRL